MQTSQKRSNVLILLGPLALQLNAEWLAVPNVFVSLFYCQLKHTVTCHPLHPHYTTLWVSSLTAVTSQRNPFQNTDAPLPEVILVSSCGRQHCFALRCRNLPTLQLLFVFFCLIIILSAFAWDADGPQSSRMDSLP